MMKFAVKAVPKGCGSARAGILSNVERLPDFRIQTPHVLMYTKGGSIPYITVDVLKCLTKENLSVMFPVPNIAHIEERMEKYDKGIAEFVGLKEYLSYCVITDPGQARREGHHMKGTVPVWSRYGKKRYNAKTYMKFIENLQPDMFLVLCDGDTTKSSSNKRVQKSLEGSLDLLKEGMEIYESSEKLQKSALLGALEGGFDLDAREKCSSTVGSTNVFGIVIDGLHDCGREVSRMDAAEVRDAVAASLKHIPPDKLRVVHGSWNPRTVLGLVEMGVDLFDSSFPYEVTEKGRALTFPNGPSLLREDFVGEPGAPCTEAPVVEGADSARSILRSVLTEPAEKKARVEDADEVSPFEMSLRGKEHADSFVPISKVCGCLTCQQHTRAYIHHLLNVNELLGSVLLMVHNLHHYLTFFSTVREAINTDRLHLLKRNL